MQMNYEVVEEITSGFVQEVKNECLITFVMTPGGLQIYFSKLSFQGLKKNRL